MCFRYPRGTVSSVYIALAQVAGIRHVAMRNEAAAAFAAAGYARVTGRPALVLTTSGPGITNTITGLATAAYEDLPLIVLGGETPRTAQGRGGIQDGSSAGLAIESMLAPVCRWTGMIRHGRNAAGMAGRAWAAAMGSKPGPVLLTIPLDIGNTTRPREADLNSEPTLIWDWGPPPRLAAPSAAPDAPGPAVRPRACTRLM
ncbi:MAG: thiamine pyrophosphate-binding protein, partial [Myxococcota bacterium]